jgi:hypothetical protein
MVRRKLVNRPGLSYRKSSLLEKLATKAFLAMPLTLTE